MTAITNEIETEVHMCAIAQREDGRLNQEIVRNNKELGVIRERRNNFEVSNTTFTITEPLSLDQLLVDLVVTSGQSY